MSAPGGYVKLWRSMLDWEWYHDVPVRNLFLHLMITVNRIEKRWQGEVILPGSMVTSIGNLAAGSGLSDQQVRTALGKLKSTGEITDVATNRFRVVSLVNWAEYQVVDSDQQASNKPINRPVTGDQQTGNRPATTTEEGENKRKGEGKNSMRTPIGVPPVGELPLSGFEAGNGNAGTGVPKQPRVDKRDPNVQGVIDYLVEQLIAKDIAKSLDPTVQANRFAASNLLKKLTKDYPTFDPLESAKRLIDFATSDPFHHRNCTKVAYLFDNMGKIAADAKAKRNDPKTQTDADRKQQLQDALDKRFAERRAATAGA